MAEEPTAPRPRPTSQSRSGVDAFQKTIDTLEGENHSLRKARRDLNARVSELEAKVPADGAVLLTKDEGALWTAFSALKLSPEKVGEMVSKVVTLEGRLADADRRIVFAAAAKELSLNADILADLLTAKGFIVEMKDITVETDGEKSKKKVPHARKAADKDAPLEPLMEIIERDLPGYLPALKVDSAETTTQTDQRPGTRAIPFPVQRGNTTVPPATNGRTLDDTMKDKAASGGYSV